MRSERHEQRRGIADFFGCEQQQVTARAFGDVEVRRVEARGAGPAGSGVWRLLLGANQERGCEDSRCR